MPEVQSRPIDRIRYEGSSGRPNLVATRTYAVSPFAEEKPGAVGGGAVYFGGYDCNDVIAPTNTAWVFRGSLDAVFKPLCC